MSDIWKVIAEFGLELHAGRIMALASKIACLNSYADFDKTNFNFGIGTEKNLAIKLNEAWSDSPELSPIEVAAALRGASGTVELIENRESVEMVWTGPSTGLVPTRHTEQALLEVINSATDKLFIVSFVAYNINVVMQALQKATNRGVQIDILLESSKSHGGKVNIDSIKTFRDRLPSANVYVWNTESEYSGKLNGSVHAKCAVADGSLAFITSANLTMAAMELNMELGVLVRGGGLAKELDSHLDALVTTKIIEKI